MSLPSLALTASDSLALLMVAVLSFSLGMILTIVVIMARSGRTRPDIEDGLLEDEEEDYLDPDNVEAGEQPAETREPWEKDPQWWQKD